MYAVKPLAGALAFFDLMAMASGVHLKDYKVEINGNNFPDPAFRKYVSENFDLNGNGSLNLDELNKAMVITIKNDNNIVDLRGIGYLDRISSITISDSSIEEMNLSETNVNAIKIENCNSLKYFTPSKDLSSVVIKNCNRLQRLGDIGNCDKLVFLDIDGMPIQDLEVGKNVKHLSVLNTDIDFVDLQKNEPLSFLTGILGRDDDKDYYEFSTQDGELYVKVDCMGYNPSEIGFTLIDEENFPDPELRALISEKYDVDDNGDLDPTEIAVVSRLIITDRTIGDLKGLELFKYSDRTTFTNCTITDPDFSKVPGNELIMFNTTAQRVALGSKSDLVNLHIENGTIDSLELGTQPELIGAYVNLRNNDMSSIDISGCPKIMIKVFNDNAAKIVNNDTPVFQAMMKTIPADDPYAHEFFSPSIRYFIFGNGVILNVENGTASITSEDIKAEPTATPVPAATSAPVATTAPAVTSEPSVTSAPAVTSEPTPTPSVPVITPEPSDESEKSGGFKPSYPQIVMPDLTKGLVRGFVESLYTLVLDRDPDEEGMEYWVEELWNFDKSGAEVASMFVLSDEFKSHETTDEEFVKILYKTFFNREPDEKGYEFWTSALGDHTFIRDQVSKCFIYSQEWADVCALYGIRSGIDTTPSFEIEASEGAIAFVERMYTRALDRDPDESGKEFWANELSNYRFTGEDVGLMFFLSPEMEANELDNDEYVKRLYLTFLDRDADADGLAYWSNALEDGMTPEQVVRFFAGSDEFKALCVEARILPYDIDR